jgi:hypothetical protein
MATEPKPDGAQLLAAQEMFGATVATLAGMRAQLVNDGWTDAEARALITSMWWQAAFGTTTSEGE